MKKSLKTGLGNGWVFIGALIVIGSLFTTRLVAGTDEEAAIEAIRAVVDQFRQSGDQQDLVLARESLHADFALHYRGPEGWVKTDRDGYKAALKAKVIGGEERTLTIERIEITGPVASAHVLFHSPGAVFDQHVNLIETETGWKIVGIVLNFLPTG